MKKMDFKKGSGLVPAIIQDCQTGSVLMLGYMNEEALAQTLSTGKVVFFSRSKGRLWQKGESSGNFLEVVSVCEDCDQDALLIRVKPKGPTCHTGEISCFGVEQKSDLDFVRELYECIEKRKKDMPAVAHSARHSALAADSYTASLFKEGLSRISQKVGEEAVEVILAAQEKDKKHLNEEICDLIYHLLVLMVEKGVEFSDLEKVLKARKK